MTKAVYPLLLAVLFVPALGCDKVSPTAPSGTILTISASPAVISLNGASTITVIGRKPNGTPLNRGTEIRLTTTLGSIEPFVQVDSDGMATATLQGDGRQGVATVTASVSSAGGGTTPPPTGGGTTPPPTGGGSNSGTSSVSLSVEIGGAAKTITLQPSPTTIPEAGGRVTLRALVRDSRGQALANQGVNFTTELGRLASGGALRQTDANGQATDTLIVEESDLANNPASITVGAQTAGGDGALVSASFEVQIVSEELRASFTCRRGGSDREVAFDSTVSGGSGTFQYIWDFGDSSGGDTRADPTHTYLGSQTQFFVVLTVIDATNNLDDSASTTVTLPVTGNCSAN